MRLTAILTLMAAPLLASEANSPSLAVVPELDLQRYAGRWFEIARLPNRFQTSCAGEVTATYRIRRDGRIDVINECSTEDGGVKSATGLAKISDAPQKLKVRFAPAWLSFLPMVWGDYWVIDLADDYSWAVVGEPGREYFWILAREPRLPEETIQGIVERAEKQGYDLSSMTRTRQRSPVEVTQK